MRVALITTGQMEFVGLPRSLERLFPGHEFASIPAIEGSGRSFEGFTSRRLPTATVPAAPSLGMPTTPRLSSLDKLVEAMAGHLVPGRRRDPPDYLILVDDLELVNADQPGVVVDQVRTAVGRYLATQSSSLASRVASAFRDQASFHLAVPMTESWLFADPAGPSHAGALAQHLPPHLMPGDPESFITNDPAYDADNGASCTRWSGLSSNQRPTKRKTEQPEWLREQRQRHPKAYLSWLARDHAVKKCSRYAETADNGQPSGSAALAGLDWAAALSNPSHMMYLRSLVEDLADALGTAAPHPALTGNPAPLTSRHHLPPNPVLRNL